MKTKNVEVQLNDHYQRLLESYSLRQAASVEDAASSIVIDGLNLNHEGELIALEALRDTGHIRGKA